MAMDFEPAEMSVGELIEKLQQFPPDARIRVSGSYDPASLDILEPPTTIMESY